MRPLFSFWSGSALGFVEHLCIRSMQRAGHKLVIYSFDNLSVPDGVELRNASEILGQDKIVRHKQTGSLALYSDLFRYAGLEKSAGIWTDLDVFFLKNIESLGRVIVGYEDRNVINGAVLYLEPDSPCLSELVRFSYSNPVIAPWWNMKRRIKETLRRALGQARTIEDMEWGIIGPAALTYFVPACGLKSSVQPVQVLSPVSYKQVPRLLKSGDDLSDLIAPESRTIHLYRSTLMRKPEAEIPQDCYLARLAREVDMRAPATFATPWQAMSETRQQGG